MFHVSIFRIIKRLSVARSKFLIAPGLVPVFTVRDVTTRLRLANICARVERYAQTSTVLPHYSLCYHGTRETTLLFASMSE